MNGFDRMTAFLQRKPADRICLYEHFWPDTQKAWAAQGHISEHEDMGAHFGFDMVECSAFNMVADLDFVPIVVAETEDTITRKDGNYAVLKQHKWHDTTPEHVDFTVKEQADWEEFIKPILRAESRRIHFEGYREAKRLAHERGQYFMWSGVGVFELMHPVCGHENMLVGMCLEPAWVHDMCDTYRRMTVEMLEELFDREGEPDGIWLYEDMGYKGAPFMSPAMYDEFIYPAHKRVIDFAKSRKLPVTMHSCGFVEPLLPGMLRAGIDCLQVIEIKAGMDLLRIHQQYGDRLSLMGGIDVRTLYSNDRAIIDAELETKIPTVKQGFGYCLHSDHSIPNTVEYDTYRYFIEKGLSLGAY